MDYREAILARVEAIGTGLSLFTLVGRNKLRPSETQLPAYIVMDGGEETDARDPKDLRAARAPRRVRMRPSIIIYAGDTASNVGTDLNNFRKAVLNAIFTDATLIGVPATQPGQAPTQGLVLDQRSIDYLGCNPFFDMGRQVEGTMELHFEFTYALRPGSI